MSTDTFTSPPIGLLFCPSCRRLLNCRFEEWVHYAREEWPRCCGQVMSFYRLSEKPTSEALDAAQEVSFE
jgi:hypothetical protein